MEWTQASGRGRLYSWTVCHPPLLPYFAERAPWVVAAVQLDEGPRMVARLAGIAPERFTFDMPLMADFEPVAPDLALVIFRPAEPEPAGP